MNEQRDPPEDAIVRSWHVNALPWAEAVRSRSIASRVLVTNHAIIDAVSELRPRRVLDIGCGEGWLCRVLADFGMDMVGIDGVPALIAEAQRLGRGRFEVCSYAEVAAGRLNCGKFDAVVCNFSLLGENSVESMLAACGDCLATGGKLVIQTLHPMSACGDFPYQDGWRTGSWAGFGTAFSDPPPWFFRTISGWYAMLRGCGFEVMDIREPVAPGALAPSSIIFICGQRSVAARV